MIEICGLRGRSREAFSKVFRTAGAANGWLAGNPSAVVHSISTLEFQDYSEEGQQIRTIAEWVREQHEPEHGCGHMQGRGAA